MATIDLGKIKLVNRGAYNNSTAYTVDDLVQSGGSTYICIQDSTGNAVTNNSYWNVLAEGGDVANTLTTQGDVLYRDGSGLARLAAGTNGHVLTTGGAGANPTWAAAVGGKILQVKQTVYKGIADITDNNGDTNPETPRLMPDLEVTITPSASTSKILLMASILGNTGNNSFTSIFRHTSSQAGSSAGSVASGTDLADPTSPSNRSPTLGPDMEKRGTNAAINESNMIFLDTPNTTSAIYYVPTIRVWSNNSFQLNHSMADGTNAGWEGRGISRLIAMEVGA